MTDKTKYKVSSFTRELYRCICYHQDTEKYHKLDTLLLPWVQRMSCITCLLRVIFPGNIWAIKSNKVVCYFHWWIVTDTFCHVTSGVMNNLDHVTCSTIIMIKYYHSEFLIQIIWELCFHGSYNQILLFLKINLSFFLSFFLP